ncbi:hypothetical protein QN355_11660 [Cryobacterium sp. 10S3]|uniref:hypothetical protein n=1 Tax=Cryobacterium sp. 10S3 TaxID=3048582 RepID=UPI002AC9324B|nr:hypothetical protein [Cryobacterium sp. 10S3]MEB0287210.1 hypothetical protein [Cryobacterium sp. 10S3]WPX14165.1 hypothetical protein RHM57_01980 [Cryobacterium sp. 10S3]
MIEIARNVTTNLRANTVDLYAAVDGKKVVFVYADRSTAFKAYRKLSKQGAQYLNTSEEQKTHLWASAERI